MKRSITGSTAVVVLGYREDQTIFCEELRHRTDVGIELYNTSNCKYLFVTGGPTSDVQVPESLPMRYYALFRGVPPTAIHTEARSTSTRENAQRTLELIHEKSLPIDQVRIVTSDYHAPRAEFVFERTFPNRISVSIGDVYAGEWDDEVRRLEQQKLAAEREFFASALNC